ncbi:hypothetical protein [Promicromonospora sukumoe]|uniref:hypothetical protein n=1 Tax=Promicromonospora sukumoe TaxID=88382 RepID=UPI0003800D93|nr:hypothetical protein [Promicromonospora sukumoe]
MTGSGRFGDEVVGERWEQSLVGVTGAPREPVRRRRNQGVVKAAWTRRVRRSRRVAERIIAADRPGGADELSAAGGLGATDGVGAAGWGRGTEPAGGFRAVPAPRGAEPHRAGLVPRGGPDDNRLHPRRPARRRIQVPAVVLASALAGSTAVLAFSPVEADRVALVCPAGASVTWVDRYRDVLGLRLPDPGDHLTVEAPVGATVAVTFTDGDGATYPTVRDAVPGAGTLVVEPPRALSAAERGRWSVSVVVSGAAASRDAVSAGCAASLP